MIHRSNSDIRESNLRSCHQTSPAPLRTVQQVRELFPGRPVFQVTRLKKSEYEPGNAINRRSVLEMDLNALWSKINSLADGSKPPVVAIASTAPCEGKTFIAQHLAIRLHDKEMRALLFDGDFYRCSAQFGLVRSRALDSRAQQFLHGSLPLANSVFRTKFPRVDFMGLPNPTKATDVPKGDLAPRMARGLQSKFKDSQYDAVVIDLPPLQSPSSSHNLLFTADVVVFCVRLNDQGAKVVHDAVSQIEKDWGVENLIVCVGDPDNRLHAGITASIFDMV